MFRLHSVVVGLSLLVASGCGPSIRGHLEVPPQIADTGLGIGDTFDVRVFGEADLTGTYRVGADGTITFPLAGVIKVEGLDPQAAAKRIAERLSDGILRNPQVSVLVKEQTSKKVVVMGQVAKPGTYDLTTATPCTYGAAADGLWGFDTNDTGTEPIAIHVTVGASGSLDNGVYIAFGDPYSGDFYRSRYATPPDVTVDDRGDTAP